MNRRGFTLIEMLVSLAITLMMMAAVVTLFQNVTDSVSGSRAIIEVSERFAQRNRLQADLVGATATMKPSLKPDSDEGYFEIIEGAALDWSSAAAGGSLAASLFGDTDDVLMFTTRSRGEPFVGKLISGNGVVESQLAEVAYYLAQGGGEITVDATTGAQLYTLYRRVLLVAPSVPVASLGTIAGVYDNNDVSVRFQKQTTGPNYDMFTNTLGDLTKRENRFAHFGKALFTFPFETVAPTPALPNGSNLPDPSSNNVYLSPLRRGRIGDDVLLNNVVSFDVQIYDPGAPVFIRDGVGLEPRDYAYQAEMSNTISKSYPQPLTPPPQPAPDGLPRAFGAYVDLGYAPTYNPPANSPSVYERPQFNGNPTAKSGFATRPFVWDTWSTHYESDGTGADQGKDGLDNDGNGIVDDPAEADTQPPYYDGIRGIRVTIRVYEPSSKQVRAVTVVQDYLPD